MNPTLPIIFLAFANHSVSSSDHLRDLAREEKAITAKLEKNDGHLYKVISTHDASLDDIVKVIDKLENRGRIAIFHFGGHGGPYGLELHNEHVGLAPVYADGFSTYLGQQESLYLVFLNACATAEQAHELHRNGIPAVIATSIDIPDEIAADFATRFYEKLADGNTSLRAAFNRAETLTKAQHSEAITGFLDRTRVSDDESAWPWQLLISPDAQETEHWTLAQLAADPLYELPTITPSDALPYSPYDRLLAGYTRQHAELFFGRNHDIRSLFMQIAGHWMSRSELDTPPIVLVYGQSGVGKSSLLEAGLLPRLERVAEVRLSRRNWASDLEATLRQMLAIGPEVELQPAWLAIEEATGRPLIVMIDQVEEAFRSDTGGAAEVASFFKLLHDLFAKSSKPRGKLILSFRKEYLAEIDEIAQRHGLDVARCFVKPLDQDGIVEVIMGPARNQRLQVKYHLTVEDKLAEQIANELTADTDSPVATVLQILLTKLWERAVATNPSSPAFTKELYNQLGKGGIQPKDFLRERLEDLETRFRESLDLTGPVQSGFVLDLLFFHTTDGGLSEQRYRSEIEKQFGHRDDWQRVLQAVVNARLLTDSAKETANTVELSASRLIHDTLAPAVRSMHAGSDAPGQRARRILVNRLQGDKVSLGKLPLQPLDDTDLAAVESGKLGMRIWSAAEVKLVADSRVARLQRIRQRKLIKWSLAALGVLFLIAAFVAIAQWSDAQNQARVALRETRRAQVAEATAIAEAHRADAQTDQALSNAEAARSAQATAEAEAENSKKQAVLARAGEMAVRAQSISSGDVERGILLAAAALTMTQSVGNPADTYASQAYRTLFGLLQQPLGQPRLRSTLDGTSPRSYANLTYSPDGRFLAASTYEAVEVWDLSATQSTPLRVFRNSGGGWPPVIAFSPDGTRFAYNYGSTVFLWATHRPDSEPARLGGHTSTVDRLSFSPDGKWLASGSLGVEVQVWNTEALKAGPVVLPAFLDPDPSNLNYATDWFAFSPDSEWLAMGGEGNSIALRSTRDLLAPPKLLSGHTGIVTELAFSADGSLLASSGRDATIRLWSMEHLDEEAVVMARDRFLVDTMRFSANGAWLIVGSESENTIELWAMDDPKERPIELDRTKKWAVSPDSRWLAVSDYGSQIHLWSLDDYSISGEQLLSLQAGDSVAFSPDSKQLDSIGSDGIVRTWRLPNVAAQPTTIDTAMSSGSAWAAISPDASWLAASEDGSYIHLWSFDRPEAAPLILTDTITTVTTLNFSPDEAWLMATSWDLKGLGLWPLNNLHKRPLVLSKSEDLVGSQVELSPDGRWLAHTNPHLVIGPDTNGTYRYVDPTIRVWSLVNPRAQPSVTYLSAFPSQVLFSPNGKWMAWASDAAISISPTGASETSPILLKGYMGKSNYLAFTPDSSKLIAAGEDNMLRLWNIDELDQPPTIVTGQNAAATAIAFSPKGDWLATGAEDGTIRLWRTEQLDAQPAVVRGDTGRVNSIEFSADEIWLLVRSEYFAHLWSFRVSSIPSISIVIQEHGYFAISPDARRLVVLTGAFGDHPTAAIYHLAADDLYAEACRYTSRNLTAAEWQQYHPLDAHYAVLCPQRPIPADVPQYLVTIAAQLALDGDVERAKQLYRQAVTLAAKAEVAPDQLLKVMTDAIVGQGRRLATDGRLEDAIGEFREARDFDPSLEIDPIIEAQKYYVEATMDHAKQLAIQGKVEDAIAAYHHAKELDPSLILDPEIEAREIAANAILSVANLLAADGNVDAAKAQYELALSIKPGLMIRDPLKQAAYTAAAAILPLADNFARDGNLDAAVSKYEEAITLDQSLHFDPLYRARQQAAQAELTPTPTLAIPVPAQVAVDNLAQSEPEGDQPRPSRAAIAQDTAASLVSRGSELARLGDIQAAVDDFAEANTLDPTLQLDPLAKARAAAADALSEQAEVLAQSGDIEAAEKTYKEIKTLDSTVAYDAAAMARNPTVARLIAEGEKLAASGNIERAVSIFAEARLLEPNLPFDPQVKANLYASATYLEQGQWLAENREVEAAAERFEAAKRLDTALTFGPLDQAVHIAAATLMAQGQLIASSGDWEGAAAKFREAQEYDSSLTFDASEEARRRAAASMIQQATELAHTGDRNGAIKALEHAAQIDEVASLDPRSEAERLFAAAKEQAKQLQAESLLEEGYQAAIALDVTKAEELFRQARDLNPALPIDPVTAARQFMPSTSASPLQSPPPLQPDSPLHSPAFESPLPIP